MEKKFIISHRLTKLRRINKGVIKIIKRARERITKRIERKRRDRKKS